MIYELRTYTLVPGKQGEYLKLRLISAGRSAATTTASSRASGPPSSAR